MVDIEELSRLMEMAASDELSRTKLQKILEKASPLEISLAEQRLLERGVQESQLKDLCKIHLESVIDRVEELKKSLGPWHPIHTLVSEHQMILSYLNDIERIGEVIKKRKLRNDEKEILIHAASHLVEAEKHHEREEKTIFPRLEKKGVTGPPRMMQMEHDMLREKKKTLLEASKKPNQNRKLVSALAEYLAYNLREHIFKEDNILYPMALDTIDDWNKVKQECDKIGYCCFTPKK